MPETPYTILVVDDEATNIDVLSQILRPFYRVQAVTNGQKAVDRCLSGAMPDLILLDVMMPVMDGYNACKAIKANPDTKDIPIIFVTAKNQVEDEQYGLEIGAIDYITKPFSPPIILQRVKNHLALHNQNRELDRLVKLRTEELNHSRQEIVHRLGRAAEFKDNETGMHVQRMSRYAYIVAKSMGCDADWCEHLLLAAPMHDIGKIGIPDAVLLKPGKLDVDEWRIMQSHAVMGAEILDGATSSLVSLSAEIALSHHEKWDGSGYPKGLVGEEIPLSGRIAAITDVFDALVSERPYKKAWTIDEAVGLIQEGSGKHFDPNVVDHFVKNLDEIIEVKDALKDK